MRLTDVLVNMVKEAGSRWILAASNEAAKGRLGRAISSSRLLTADVTMMRKRARSLDSTLSLQICFLRIYMQNSTLYLP